MTRQLFLDCDGVLADFDAGARELLGMSSRSFEDRYGKREFWRRIAGAPVAGREIKPEPVGGGRHQIVAMPGDNDAAPVPRGFE